MALLQAAFSVLFVAVVTHGAPVAAPGPDPNPGLPSLLTINTEEELGLYSKKWRMTPVQMCTLMGHQMTVAQPLLDINHPLVSHLPSIGEMAMSDAVMICEKVLNDAKGRTASVTTVVEETRQEYNVPRNFMFDDIFEEFTGDLMESIGFTEDDMQGAIDDNEDALVVVLEGQEGQEGEESVGEESPSEPNVEDEKEDCEEEKEKEKEDKEPESPPAPTTPTPPPKPRIADTVKRMHTG